MGLPKRKIVFQLSFFRAYTPTTYHCDHKSPLTCCGWGCGYWENWELLLPILRNGWNEIWHAPVLFGVHIYIDEIFCWSPLEWTSQFSLQDLKIFIRSYHLTPCHNKTFHSGFLSDPGSHLRRSDCPYFTQVFVGSRSLWCFPFAWEAAQCARAVGDFVEISEPELVGRIFNWEGLIR